MQSYIANIANLVTDAPSQGGNQRDTNRSDDRRDEFASMVDRVSNTDSRNSISARDRDLARDTAAKEESATPVRRADDSRDSDDKRVDNSRDDYSKQDTSKADSRRDSDDKTDNDKSYNKSADDKQVDTKTAKNSDADKSANEKADNNKTDNDSDAKDAKDAKSAFLLQANELLDNGGVASDDAAQPPVGGGVTPDVTAILTDAPPVQNAGDTNLLTASQPMGLLALAALIEKASAALEAQKGAAQKNVAASNLTILSAPIAPVVTDETVIDSKAGVTPLVDVLGQAELPGQVKPQQLADIDTKDAAKMDSILNAVKQAVQPASDTTQALQLKVSAEEVIDPADALAKVTADPEVSKVVQKFLDSAQGDGKKTTADLVASLKEVLSQRADKDNNILPFGQAVSQAVHASLDLTHGQDDTSLLTQGGTNSQIMSQLAADALRHAGAANMKNESSFLGMLDKTTNHVPVSDQVMVNIKQAVADGASHIKIQLHPEDLGRVDVRMSVGVDGKTSMTIVADSRDTLDMLQREARNLERSLTDLGLKTDAGGLSFHLRQQGQDQQQKFTKSGTGYASVAEVEAEEPVATTNLAAYRLSVSEGVDIRV